MTVLVEFSVAAGLLASIGFVETGFANLHASTTTASADEDNAGPDRDRFFALGSLGFPEQKNEAPPLNHAYPGISPRPKSAVVHGSHGTVYTGSPAPPLPRIGVARYMIAVDRRDATPALNLQETGG